MFCGATERQRLFIIPLNPEPFGTPRNWRQLPAIRRNQRQKILNGNFERINSYTAS
jgi:hypothetical protein